MEEMYKKSLQMIKNLQTIPSKEEWNDIAKKNGLMNFWTLQYIENKKFDNICKSIREAS